MYANIKMTPSPSANFNFRFTKNNNLQNQNSTFKAEIIYFFNGKSASGSG